MPDFHELRQAGEREGDMLAHFRNLVRSVGLTIVGERELPDGHGVQLLTLEKALPTYYYASGCWDVQGKRALEWIAKLKGDIPEASGLPALDGPRLGDATRLRTGVLLHFGELKEEAVVLSKLLRVAGLEPAHLQAPHQPWGSVIDNVEFFRLKAQYGLVVATPGELKRFGLVYTGLPLLVGLLGPRNCLVLLKAEEHLPTPHFPSAVEVITFDEIDDGTQAAVCRAFFKRAERPLRLHIRDHASDQFWRSYFSSAGDGA